MAVAYYIFMFVLGFVLLICGSSLFVDSAVSLANKLHLPEVLIGATIVSIGTTLPESLFSTMASVHDLPDMALGNALGSILCNTGFIAGFMLMLRPIHLEKKALGNIMSGAFFLGAAFVVYLTGGMTVGGLSRVSGIILLLMCLLYIGSTVRNAVIQEEQERTAQSEERQSFGASDVLRIVLEAVVLYIGASFLVEFGPKLARSFGVPEVIISLTFVALGTSLPEFVTSLVALKKKHSALSLGNIIGADILNFVLVGGLSAVICPIPYLDSVMGMELPFIFFLLFVLCFPSIVRQKAGRIQGCLLLGGYVIYLILTIS